MFYKVSHSDLGGHHSDFVHCTKEDEGQWTNNIFHNGHYGIFCLRDGKLELISKHYEMPKFRKCKCDNLEVAEKKILAWLNQ
ncbi:hypothetical protein SCRM01_240 [Synechococcus phage S-CRM01]|uniref:hypothetical protein n=1 Tax=Synechococcus phage S-CRM01 TaxID=1026955 RepID=UPI000209E441|nr:hypothetical protein SCRM01_240 [Synechococcus phage S-CRM01]AEC53186.1 hypothetical protein SCRM01_240 [Synechococcus phage S-CRM01]